MPSANSTSSSVSLANSPSRRLRPSLPRGKRPKRPGPQALHLPVTAHLGITPASVAEHPSVEKPSSVSKVGSRIAALSKIDLIAKASKSTHRSDPSDWTTGERSPNSTHPLCAPLPHTHREAAPKLSGKQFAVEQTPIMARAAWRFFRPWVEGAPSENDVPATRSGHRYCAICAVSVPRH
jgi:hypothetical protein